jgi:hypothetical protein
VRIVVTSTSYGGEPDATCVAGGIGEGNPSQQLVLARMAAFAQTNIYTLPAPAATLVHT